MEVKKIHIAARVLGNGKSVRRPPTGPFGARDRQDLARAKQEAGSSR